ncbi:MAG: large subunit ribosomal protein L24 [bacterium]|jgi:large subunit ribosomal protein L24
MKKNKIKLHLKKGDVVQVICGKDKGSTGEILNIDREKERVIVKGANIITKHVKPNPNNQQGGIVKMEASIHYSNVLLFNKESSRGERIQIQINEDGTKTRVFAKSGTPVD